MVPLCLAMGLAGSSATRAAPQTVALPTAPAAASETVFDMKSSITGRTYRIQIFRPVLPPPPGGYPVIFLTDGSTNFRTAADQMWARQYVDLQPALVVGLSYPSNEIQDWVKLRTWDLTPEKPNAEFLPVFKTWSRLVPFTEADAGGGELFYRFITEELRPKLASTMPIDLGNQALYGHSLGGLFTFHVLLNHPQAFSSYMISSPSLGFNQGSVLKKEPQFAAALKDGRVQPRILFMMETTDPYPEWDAMIERFRAMKGGPRFEVQSARFADVNHYSVAPGTIARGLGFAFSKPPAPRP
jgi:hypothetical protein